MYDKPFKTFDEQIEFLEKNYNLNVPNKVFAYNVLSTISYYDLINGYQEITMKDNKFIANLSLEYITYFHLLDKDFQNILLKYSLIIENIFKTKLAYVLAKNHGVHQDEYLNNDVFKYTSNNDIFFSNIKRQIWKRISKFKPHPTQYYIEHHNHVPPWILCRNIEFGNAINLYRLMKNQDKYELANLLLPNSKCDPQDKYDFSVAALQLIKDYRNKIAHNLKFVTYISKNKIPKKSAKIIFNNPEITNGIETFNNIETYILSTAILLDHSLLCSRFCFELTKLFKPDQNLASSNGAKRFNYENTHIEMVAYYLIVIKASSNFLKKLELVLFSSRQSSTAYPIIK